MASRSCGVLNGESDLKLKLSNLSKRFGDHLALDSVSLELPEVHSLALIGPSGGGKTVLGLHFVAEGLRHGEKCVYVSLQESEGQLLSKTLA